MWLRSIYKENGILDFLNRHKRLFIIIVLIICIAAIIATVNYRFRPTFLDDALGYVVSPVQGAISGAANWVKQKTAYFTDNYVYKQENIKLSQTIDELKAENKRLKLVEEDYQKLTQLLVLNEKYPEIKKVGALVIGKDTSNWFNTFTVNKGTNDGLQNNLMVLTSGGLVGRITKAADTYSEVLTIIDNNSAVSVKCLRTEDIGLLKGDISLTKSGLCRMEFKKDAEILEGDELVTSHLSDIYPPGIAVGIVKEVRMDDKGLSKYAIVMPYVDFSNIESVLVSTERYNRFRTGEPGVGE